MSSQGSEIKRLGDESVRRIVSEQAITDLSSIVKELVDNALDAESTTIKIRLFGQGLDIIEVSDDGHGVPPEARPNLAQRYATSKISTFEDIYSGTGLTMGFRGEALFSMACLSKKLVVATRTEDDEMAEKLDFGRDGNLDMESVQSIHRKIGTTVAVLEPFSALPARRVDLSRRIRGERSKLFRLMESYAIFNVGTQINLIDITSSGREDVALATSSRSTKLEENVSSVLGHKFLGKLTAIDINLEDFLKRVENVYNWGIQGLISKSPKGDISGRIVNYYCINGRVVELPKLTTVLRKVWHGFGGSKKPSCILSFTLPNDAFDINLSPDKRQVLLSHEQEICELMEQEVIKLWSSQTQGVFKVQELEAPLRESEDCDDEVAWKMHKRRNAFVHDLAKAKLQHDMEERKHSEKERESNNYNSRFDNGDSISKSSTNGDTMITSEQKTGEEIPNEQLHSKCIKENIGVTSPVEIDTEATPVAMKSKSFEETEDVARPRVTNTKHASNPEANTSKNNNAGMQSAQTNDHELAGPPGKSDSDKDTSNVSSPEVENMVPDRTAQRKRRTAEEISDMERRKWIEVQARFNSGDERRSKRRRLPPVTPDETDQIEDQSSESESGRTNLLSQVSRSQESNTKDQKPANSEKTSTQLSLQQFAFQPSATKSVSKRQRQTRRLHERMKFENSDEPSVSKEVKSTNENFMPSREKQISTRSAQDPPTLDEDATMTFKDPMAIVDIEADGDRALNSQERPTGGGSSAGGETESKPEVTRKAIVWNTFKGTDEVCRSTRVERLEMLKRRLDLKLAKKSMHETISVEMEANDVTNSVGMDSSSDPSTINLSKSQFRADMQVIGQFNMGFILARCKSNHLWILDQHACDEKYNFEQLCKNTVIHEQKLLIPMKLELSPAEEACILDNMKMFEANGFRFRFQPEAPIHHRLSLTALPHSGAQDGRKAVQFGKEDVRTLCSILMEGSSYDAGDGGTGTDGSGMYGNNAVRRYASTASSQFDAADRIIARLPKAIAMFASRACRTSIMIGTALSQKEMEKIVKRLADVDHPWNCPHGRPTMRHVGEIFPTFLRDERNANDHISEPTVSVAPMTQDED